MVKRELSVIYGTAYTDTKFAIPLLEKEQIAEMIPKGMYLTDVPGVDKNKHPLMFLYGRQETPRLVVKSLNIKHKVLPTYDEFVLGIPYVRHKKFDNKDRTFLPLLYLNSFRAILTGVLGYGMNKKLATIKNSQKKYEISPWEFEREKVIHADFEKTGQLINPKSVEFSGIREILEEHELMFKYHSSHILTTAKFNWQVDRAKLNEIVLSMKIKEGYLQGLPDGLNYKEKGLTRKVEGCFRLQGNWTLTTPKTCFI